MFNFFTKFIFSLRKPQIVIVTGMGKKTAAEAIFRVLKPNFKAKKIKKKLRIFDALRKRVLILEVSSEKVGELFFLVKNSKKPILVVTNIGEIQITEEFLAGERGKTREIRTLARDFPLNGNLILNFDDETSREIKEETQAPALTFGFQKEANLFATDIKENTGTNFKINYEGNIVPCWLENLFGKEQVYAALAAVACGIIFNLNLVDISQALKKYFSVPGRQRLIKGVKNTLILDDSENASLFSMMEALEILGRVKAKGKKIAVLGDILGIGKYAIEAHEAIGEKVVKVADLLFTVGPRAKFIAQGAIMKGFNPEKIFKFDKVEQAGKGLQEEIREGDLVLVDGSKEMKIGKIVEEIKEL